MAIRSELETVAKEIIQRLETQYKAGSNLSAKIIDASLGNEKIEIGDVVYSPKKELDPRSESIETIISSSDRGKKCPPGCFWVRGRCWCPKNN